jgi:hypothetical protein
MKWLGRRGIGCSRQESAFASNVLSIIMNDDDGFENMSMWDYVKMS